MVSGAFQGLPGSFRQKLQIRIAVPVVLERFLKSEEVFVDIAESFRGVSACFGESQVRDIGIEGFLGKFQKHFRELKMIFDGFQRICGTLHRFRGSLSGISAVFQKVSEDFRLVAET